MKLFDLFRRSYEDRIDEAANNASRAAADVAYYRSMGEFYASRVVLIDQTLDWWGYAKTRQKLQDARDDLDRALTVSDEADARLEALVAARGDLA